jgi:uncharacterized protein YkwD
MLRALPALALVWVCLAAQPARAPARDPKLAALERQVFQLVNNERTYRGLPELQWDDRLAAVARRHASNMAARGFFAHVDPVHGDVADRLAKAGIAWSRFEENLLQEWGYEDSARSGVLSWMASPGHRKNILDKDVTLAGVGAARRADGTLFLAQEFIRP